MWISKKEYNFLRENAEKNIDAECEILRAKEKQEKAIARAMEEYSAVLKERDELKQRVIELENRIDKTIKMRETTQEEGQRYIDNISTTTEIDFYNLLGLEKPNFTELKNPFIRDNFENEACKNCSSNPKNGGTGICFCTLGTSVIY